MKKANKEYITNVQTFVRTATRHKGAELRDLEKDYSTMRRIALGRIDRGAPTDGLQLPTLKELKETAGGDYTVQFAKTSTQLAKWLESPISTYKGRQEMAKQKAETLFSLGYESVTPVNVEHFNDFMDMWRRKYEKYEGAQRVILFDSDEAAEIFDKLVEQGKIKGSSNKSRMSRAFNDYLRSHGMADKIRKL